MRPLAHTYWIHIGIHKTGTTFLQRYFASRRRWLASHDVLFPETGFRVPHTPSTELATHGHGGLLQEFKKPENTAAKKRFETLHREISGSRAGHVLFSSELFCAPHNRSASIEGFKALCAGNADVRILVYLRRQDRWLDSFYREVLGWKSRRVTRDIEGFFDEEAYRLLDFPERLSPWIEAFGSDAVTVRSYDDAVAGPGILADVLSCIGISESPPPHDFGDMVVNPSLNPSLVDLQRAINTLPDLPDENKIQLTRLLLEAGARQSPSQGSLVDDAFWMRLAAQFSDANRRIARDLISGPHERFLFPSTPPCTAPVAQKFDFETTREILHRPLPSCEPAPRPVAASAPQFRGSFGIVATLNERPQQAREFINYHLNLGPSHFVVFFDNPDDPVIGDYQQDPRVTVVPCTKAHWLTAIGSQPEQTTDKLHNNLRLGRKHMQELGVEWVISMDGDELLYVPGTTVSKFLASATDETDIIRLRPLESVHHDQMNDQVCFSSSYFKTSNEPKASDAVNMARLIRGDASEMTRNGFFGHTAGRSFFRSNAEIDIHTHHVPKSTIRKLNVVHSNAAHVLHYDCISFEGWKRKWKNRIHNPVPSLSMHEKRVAQMEQIQKAMDSGEDTLHQLFWRWHWWSPIGIRLGLHSGLLRRISIPDNMFSRSEPTLKKSGSFGVVATVSEDPEQTREFINYHLKFGASHVVVYLDAPDDPVIRDYENDLRVTCVPCTQTHWQTTLGRQPESMAEKLRTNLRSGKERLRRLGIEWTLSLDGDELLYSDESPTAKLQALGRAVQVVQLPPLESIQHRNMDNTRKFASRYFKQAFDNDETAIGRRQRIGTALLYRKVKDITRMGFYGHIEGKFLLRSSAGAKITGSHSVALEDPEARTVRLRGFYVLHFDCMSFDHWQYKWWRRIVDDTCPFTVGKKRRKQEALIRQFVSIRDEKNLKRLYRQLHWWSLLAIGTGLLTGLLRRISIEDHYFDRD